MSPTDETRRTKRDSLIGQRADPIIISGIGGSGTRVVAEVLRRCGVYLGQDLNSSLDDYVFTYLFKHPRRFARAAGRGVFTDAEWRRRLTLHRRLLLGRLPDSVWAWGVLLEAGASHAVRRYDPLWVAKRWSRLLRARAVGPDRWGFKEPHVMSFVEQIGGVYPRGRLVLVVRNGLDMAYSHNDQQFRYWSCDFDIDASDGSPRNRFEFWARANLEARQAAISAFGDRFLLVRLEELCQGRSGSLPRLFSHCGIDPESAPPEVWTFPRLPSSHGRYRRFDHRWIDADIEVSLEELGYRFESPLER